MSKRAGWLPPPFEVIDDAIKETRPSRTQYMLVRRAVLEWHASVLGQDWDRSRTSVPEEAMKFRDHQLTPEEMSEAEAWLAEDDTDVDHLTNELLDTGYRMSFVWDSKNGCVVVSVIGKTADNPNRDLCMTTRHRTVRLAMQLALYKHFIIFHGGAWGEVDPNALHG